MPTPKKYFYPLSIKERFSYLFVGRGAIFVKDSALLLQQNNSLTHIPVGRLCSLCIEPGVSITSEAIKLCAQYGTTVLWTGEGGVRLYSMMPVQKNAKWALLQAKLALDEELRMKVARKMFQLRFGDSVYIEDKTIEQLRGLEGMRVRGIYQQLAKKHGVHWKGRFYGHGKNNETFEDTSLVNQCITAANQCLYGICACATGIMGLSSYFGFVHWGSREAFICDIADLFKFQTVIPLAFSVAKKNSPDCLMEIRHKCRDVFREIKFLDNIIDTIKEVLLAPGINEVSPPENVVFLEEDEVSFSLEKCLL